MFSVVNFFQFLVIKTLYQDAHAIRIDLNYWILIRMETNADPKHYSQNDDPDHKSVPCN
jgi:hypothetical protein